MTRRNRSKQGKWMSTEAAATPAAVQSRGFIAEIGGLFESFVVWVMVGLMAVGLVALALTWRTSDIVFGQTGELTVTQSTWWGFRDDTIHVRASSEDGWMSKEEGEAHYVQMKNRGIRLRN